MGGTIHRYLPELHCPSRVLRGRILPRYHFAMIDDANAIEIPFDPPDADLTYRNYLRTCVDTRFRRFFGVGRDSMRWRTWA